MREVTLINGALLGSIVIIDDSLQMPARRTSEFVICARLVITCMDFDLLGPAGAPAAQPGGSGPRRAARPPRATFRAPMRAHWHIMHAHDVCHTAQCTRGREARANEHSRDWNLTHRAGRSGAPFAPQRAAQPSGRWTRSRVARDAADGGDRPALGGDAIGHCIVPIGAGGAPAGGDASAGEKRL